ncbi:MAG TPA: ABC transporter substrate-binding protein [Burkholderiaceae bacterium]|nr:ABC transporter substrate-binding protein [Burkholderiaceae bacterium]
MQDERTAIGPGAGAPRSTRRRRLLTAGAAGFALTAGAGPTRAQNLPGVTATELRIGSTTSLSGPVSALGTINRAQAAYFKMLNERGGIAGRQIKYIIYDDGFSPPKTLEMTRRLIEQDEVAFLFSMLGTGPNSAVVKYVNSLGVPHLFLSVNGDKWGDYKTYPWTIPFAPSARVEAQIFVKYALQQNPNAKIAILYQNDDLGRDFVAGARDVLGPKFDAIAKTASYEVTDATVDSQLIQLQGTGANVLISGVTGKFGAMSIRKVFDMGWKPMHFITSGASTVASTINPAGPERAIGLMTSVYAKDPSDPGWADDAGIKEYKAFMAKYYPEGNANEGYNAYGYLTAIVMHKVLEQCNGDFSRKNVMAQVNNLKNVENPILLPGIKVNTSPTNHHPLRQMQLQRWDGKVWQRFGEIIEGANI